MGPFSIRHGMVVFVRKRNPSKIPRSYGTTKVRNGSNLMGPTKGCFCWASVGSPSKLGHLFCPGLFGEKIIYCKIIGIYFINNSRRTIILMVDLQGSSIESIHVFFLLFFSSYDGFCRGAEWSTGRTSGFFFLIPMILFLEEILPSGWRFVYGMVPLVEVFFSKKNLT